MLLSFPVFWNTSPYTFMYLGHNPEDGSKRFLRKDDKFLPDSIASHPTKQFLWFHFYLPASIFFNISFLSSTFLVSPEFLFLIHAPLVADRFCLIQLTLQ
jgi:hypothetical protein